MSELGLQLEERDGGIYVIGVQEHGCVAAHGMLLFPSPMQSCSNLISYTQLSEWTIRPLFFVHELLSFRRSMSWRSVAKCGGHQPPWSQ